MASLQDKTTPDEVREHKRGIQPEALDPLKQIDVLWARVEHIKRRETDEEDNQQVQISNSCSPGRKEPVKDDAGQQDRDQALLPEKQTLAQSRRAGEVEDQENCEPIDWGKRGIEDRRPGRPAPGGDRDGSHPRQAEQVDRGTRGGCPVNDEGDTRNSHPDEDGPP